MGRKLQRALQIYYLYGLAASGAMMVAICTYAFIVGEGTPFIAFLMACGVAAVGVFLLIKKFRPAWLKRPD